MGRVLYWPEGVVCSETTVQRVSTTVVQAKRFEEEKNEHLTELMTIFLRCVAGTTPKFLSEYEWTMILLQPLREPVEADRRTATTDTTEQWQVEDKVSP